MDGAAAAGGGAAGAAAMAGGGAAVADPAAAAAAAAAMAILGNANDAAANRVADLEQQQRAINQQRKQVAKDLKNEKKKRQRVMDKAKTLSDAELLQVLGARANANAKAKAKAKAKAMPG